MADLALKVSLQALDKATGPLRRMMGAAAQLKKQLHEAETQMAAFRRQQGLIEALRRQQQATAKTRQALGQARQRLQELAQAQGQAGQATAEHTRQMKSAEASVRRLRAERARQLLGLRELRQRLVQQGMQAGQLQAHEARLKNSMHAATAAIDRRRQALEKLNRADRHKRADTQTAKYMAGAGVAMHWGGRMALDKAAGLLAPGEEFESQMSRVQALSRLNKDSPEFKALREQARQLGADTMFSATQAAQGQAFLAMAGFKPGQIQAAMPGLLDMAKAGDTDLGRTADITSNILGGFGIAPEQMGRVSDVLTQTFTTANVNLEMLGETMSYVAPQARLAGADLETVAAMTGLLGNVGIQGSKAGTALRAMLLRLSAPTGKAANALRQLKVQTADAQGNLRGIVPILADVAKAAEGMGSAKKAQYIKKIFGEEPSSAIAELLDKTRSGDITAYLDKVRDSQGAAARTAKVMSDNMRGLRDELSSAWDDVRITIFDESAGEIKAWGRALLDAVRWLGEWAKANPVAVRWAVRITLAIGALAAVFGALLVPLAAVMLKYVALRLIFAKAGVGLSLMGKEAAGASRSAGWLARAAAGIKTAWSALPGLLARAAAGLKSAWGAVVQMGGFALQKTIVGLRLLGGQLVQAGAWLLRFGGVAARAFAVVGRAALALMASPIGIAFGLMAAAVYMWVTRWQDIKGGALLLWQDIKQAFLDGLAWLQALPQKMWEAGSNIIGGVIGGIRAKLGELKSSIVSVADSARGWFAEKLKINSPSRVFMELGGWVSEGAALGIQGKAALVARAAAAMAAMPAMAAAPAMAGGVPALAARAPAAAAQAAPAINITIHAAPGQDAQAIAQAVSRELDRRERERAARAYSRIGDI